MKIKKKNQIKKNSNDGANERIIIIVITKIPAIITIEWPRTKKIYRRKSNIAQVLRPDDRNDNENRKEKKKDNSSIDFLNKRITVRIAVVEGVYVYALHMRV